MRFSFFCYLSVIEIIAFFSQQTVSRTRKLLSKQQDRSCDWSTRPALSPAGCDFRLILKSGVIRLYKHIDIRTNIYEKIYCGSALWINNSNLPKYEQQGKGNVSSDMEYSLFSK